MSPPPLHISHTEILVRLSPFFPISFSYLSFLYPILLQTFSLLASLSLSPSISLSLSFSISVSIYLSLSQSLSIPFSLSVPASLCLLLSLPPSPISFSDSLYNSLSLFISLSLPLCQYLPLSLSLSLSPCFLIYPFIPPPSSLALIIENASAVESLAIIHVDAIAQITRVIKTNQPSSSSLLISSSCLPHESAFIVEILKKLFQWGSKIRTMEHLVGMVSTV